MAESWMGQCPVCESGDVYAVHSAGGLVVCCHACDARAEAPAVEEDSAPPPDPVVPERARTGRAEEHRVTYRRSLKHPEELYASVLGTASGARRQALGLLRSLREESGCCTAAVFVDGKRVKGGHDV